MKHDSAYVKINLWHIRHVTDKHPDNIDHRAISEVNKESANKPKQNIEPNKEDDEKFTIIKKNINPGEELMMKASK